MRYIRFKTYRGTCDVLNSSIGINTPVADSIGYMSSEQYSIGLTAYSTLIQIMCLTFT